MINNFSLDREVNQKKEYFFKNLLSSLPDLIFQLSYSKDGVLTFPFFNKAIINYFELTNQEVRNFNMTSVFREKIHPNDFNSMLISLQELENIHNGHSNFEQSYRQKG